MFQTQTQVQRTLELTGVHHKLLVVICRTSRSAFPGTFHPEVTIADQPTQVMCEMVGAVDPRALGERVGHLTREELRAVEDALLLILYLA